MNSTTTAPPPDAQIPQTGGQTAAWFPLLAAAGVFAAGACVGRRRRGR
ncbi:MAG TPA: LPXTG cell wall anchor domain-containing protein [Candidatus Fimenecus excrementigallinarum]|uniref:LPXTG cell wall anchor domain-containing protein n=1 Tax=Candidatus Fimenecus excrementigallinarum TaxID=2840816 RepID=A0A9D1LDV3_9FIRM|nr:LPXTG cell wall anchor domain-containing protein [Candidatus Fimenecus excrementigallinarum]